MAVDVPSQRDAWLVIGTAEYITITGEGIYKFKVIGRIGRCIRSVSCLVCWRVFLDEKDGKEPQGLGKYQGTDFGRGHPQLGVGVDGIPVNSEKAGVGVLVPKV